MTDTTLSQSLAASVGKLATLREEIAQRTEKIRAARAGFDQTIAADLQAVEGVKRLAEAEESAVRGMALVEFETTGNAKPAPGVSVVQSKEYDIDEAAGLMWAKHHGMCLLPEALDVKAAKKMAAAGAPLPFVTVQTVPTVRVATDLLKALGEGA